MWRICALAVCLAGLMLAVSCTSEPAETTGEQVVDQEQVVATVDTGAVVVPTVGTPVTDAVAVAEEVLGSDAVTATNGLAYQDTIVGTGPAAEACDFLGVNYSGKTGGGAAFEGTDELGRPLRFSPGNTPPQVIAGLDQAVLGMQLGGTRTIVMPPYLAVEPESFHVMPPVPQGEALVFDVGLVELSPPPVFPDSPPEVEYVAGEHGLEYAILEKGNGPEAAADDVVQIHYTGWMEGDPSPMDSSMQPAVGLCRPYVAALGLGEVIVGWDLGIPGMKVGERRQLRIPPKLAFGSAGYGNVPPDTTLIFQVALLAVE